MSNGHSASAGLQRRTRRRGWLVLLCIGVSCGGSWLLGTTSEAAAASTPGEDQPQAAASSPDSGAVTQATSQVQAPEALGAWGRWRERTRVFSSWQVLEAPLWHLIRGHAAGDSTARASVLRQALLGQAPAAEHASRRLQRAVEAVCAVLQYFGVPGPSSADVEAYVSSDVLPPQGYRQGPMWAIVAGPFPRVMLVASPELMQRLSDDELRALVGLHLARLLQCPQLSGARQLGGWWLLHRLYQALNSELPEDLPNLKAFFAQPVEEWMKTGLGPALRAILRDAAVIETTSRLGRLRNIQLIKAADRFALIAGGSVEVASSAIAKVHDYASEGLALELRHKSMQKWALTPRGRRLLLLGQHFSQVGTPTERPRSKHWALVSAAVALVLVSGMLVSASLAAMALSFLLAVSAALAVVVTSTAVGGAPSAAQKAAIACLALYSTSAALVWWRCAQLRARGRNHTTVASLVQEALPAAAEAAAGAALLAQCSGSIRRRPLGELDHELRSHWATSLRGLSAKLADLRRLVGAGDAGGAMGDMGAARLCAKLDLEVRRALSAELLWMKGALDLENEGALCRALFWWLHDDGEHGAWGSPRPASAAAHLGCEPSTLEKLSYPSLANAGVGHKNLQEPSPDHERTAEEVTRAAAALAAQHQQLEWLRAALHPSDGTSPPTDLDPSPSPGAPITLLRLFSSGYANRRAEAKVREFLEQCEGVPSKSMGHEGSYGRCWEAALLLALFAAVAALRAAFLRRDLLVGFGGGWWCFMLQVVTFLLANVVLQLRLLELRLPYLWARLERCLLALASERAQLVELVRLPGRSRAEQLAHLKALMLMQGVRTAQNLDHLALCVEAEALRSAASSERSGRGGHKVLLTAQDSITPKDTDIYQYRRSCLQLFYAVLPRHGRRGQRQVSSDTDIYQAMAWFDVQSQRRAFSVGGALPARLKALQLALATSQRQLWMLFRLCNVRSMARPVAEQGTLSALLNCQLRPIVLERKLELEVLLPSRDSAPEDWLRRPADSSRILGDLDSTTGSNDDCSDASSLRSGVARRILASGSTTPASECHGADRRETELRCDLLRGDEDAWDGASSDAASIVEGEGVHRILAASDASDGASSDSASSAGFNSFGVTHSSMWSGMSHSAASSTSSLAEDMLTHRRPLLEGYAHALRPLFMTRGDIMHLLAKFPTQVLMGGAAAGMRSFAAHRELLEELFGSFLVAVKSPERRGKIKLAFGTSFTYDKAPYTVGPVQTTVQLVAHGVRRTGHEQFPVVYEDEHEDEERSEAAVSAARDEGGQEGHGVLEFEEIVVPLTEVSSRELFLAELMQSDQCQLLASLSQGAHSKYGQRALRRRRRTLRHVREATQLLVNVPDQ